MAGEEHYCDGRRRHLAALPSGELQRQRGKRFKSCTQNSKYDSGVGSPGSDSVPPPAGFFGILDLSEGPIYVGPSFGFTSRVEQD